jgi:hypothetical protein
MQLNTLPPFSSRRLGYTPCLSIAGHLLSNAFPALPKILNYSPVLLPFGRATLKARLRREAMRAVLDWTFDESNAAQRQRWKVARHPGPSFW